MTYHFKVGEVKFLDYYDNDFTYIPIGYKCWLHYCEGQLYLLPRAECPNNENNFIRVELSEMTADKTEFWFEEIEGS